MKVQIHNIYTGITKVIDGAPAKVEDELYRLYPWLYSEDPADQGDVSALIEHLNSFQAFDAHIVEHETEALDKSEVPNIDGEARVVEEMLGYNHQLQNALEAARFLAGGVSAHGDRLRQALWEADGDVEEAALLAYGIAPTEANLKALRAILDMSKVRKSDQEPVKASSVESGHQDANETADEVRRAFEDGFVVPVHLDGKHSKGTLLASDQLSGKVWLLKPGSGGQTPAAGARQDASSQSRREAAFWHVADEWGLGDYIPRADLLLIDGREYAAINLLPWSYKPLAKIKNQRDSRSILHPYLKGGILHRWAVLDFVLGNPDRHGNNIMVSDDIVKLIDHGSAMAGSDFDPAGDKNSFTPFYLRAWAPGKFSRLDAATKLKYMPRVDHQTEEDLRQWIEGLHAVDLDKVLLRYGVDPTPEKARLAKLKTMMVSEPADLVINRLWVET